ncbi:MAG TPA: hypothetical protein DD424_09840 [Porphyromonadaceae bacterium]|nr:hypothetical protein [Porphyromonadaceae bacterium]
MTCCKYRYFQATVKTDTTVLFAIDCSDRHYHFIVVVIYDIVIVMMTMLFMFLMLLVFRTIIVIIAKRKFIVPLYTPMRAYRPATA